MLRSAHRSFGLCLLRLACVCLILLPVLTPGPLASAAPPAASVAPGYERWIVQLDAPPQAVASASLADALARPQATAQQDAVIEAITATLAGASIEARLGLVNNALVLRTPRADPAALAALGAIPGIRAIYPDSAFFPAGYESAEIIGAPALWQAVGGQAAAGAGVRIAIIDSGIAIGHPMFDPTGLSYPPGYPVGWPLHTTPKVIAARAYFRPTDPPLAGEGTPTPGAAGSLHGTHAAGIAAGLPITVTLYGEEQSLSGVAPGALLMNYRIFYPAASGGLQRAYTSEILQAIEDAVRDGAQVLYNGWSGEPASAFAGGPIEEALRAAAGLGVVVVAPVGNDGPGQETASRLPGGIETPITVGIQGSPFGRALFGPSVVQDIGPLPIVSVADIAPDGSPLACAPLPPASLVGAAALVMRSGCPFADKSYHAQQAGAVLTLIYNTAESVSDMSCTGARCAPGVITIPTAMLARGLGEQLLAWLHVPGATPRIALSATGRVNSDSPELVAPASGRGSAYLRALKPDLIAPGVGVVSAAWDGAHGYAALSGSSVAAAHVAGAAAALLQAHPAWGHREAKAALMGTARLGAPNDLPPRTGVRDRGAGLADLSRALTPTVLLDPPSLSQPTLTAGVARPALVNVRDMRTSGEPLAWQVRVSASAGLTLVGPSAITTTAGTTTPFTLTFMAHGGHSGSVEAMVTLERGDDVYRLPVWGYVQPMPEAGRLLLLDNDVEFGGGGTETRPAIVATLNALGVAHDVWDADARFGLEQTLPDLEVLARYAAIIWTTGDKRNPDGVFLYSTPLTARDQQLLMSYLDGGGRLLAMGQNVAAATDIVADPDPTWGRSILYHGYLGAHWLQEAVFAGGGAPSEAVAVTGLTGSFMQGITLDLGPLGSGAGNQRSIDELGLGGSRQGYDAELVQPVAAAISPAALEGGYVMLAKSDHPTLENPQSRIPYRVLHQSFGLEGVNARPSVSTVADLLRRQLDWLLGEVRVTVPDGLTGGPHALARLQVEAASTVGARIVGYRWLIEGSGGARLIESSGPVVHVLFEERGEYALTVEATDALGIRALGQGRVRIISGGASNLSVDRTVAAPGDTLVYSVTLANTEPSALSGAFTLPLPAGTAYVAHAGAGAQWVGNALSWAGVLAPTETLTATLTAQIGPDLAPSTVIEATATYQLGGETFERSATTTMHGSRRIFLPLILR